MKKTGFIVIIFAVFLLAGCGTLKSLSNKSLKELLPSSKTTVSVPWKNFEEAKNAYDQVIPGRTTIADLKKLGFDPYVTPNIKILNSTDIINRFMPNPTIRKEYLDGGIQKAIEARGRCFGYLFEPQVIDRKNTASFWLHIFKFKRQTTEYGWQFKGLMLVVDNLVVYKDPVGGQPKIDVVTTQKNPLGPLQELGDLLIGAIRNFLIK